MQNQNKVGLLATTDYKIYPQWVTTWNSICKLIGSEKCHVEWTNRKHKVAQIIATDPTKHKKNKFFTDVRGNVFYIGWDPKTNSFTKLSTDLIEDPKMILSIYRD